MSVLQKQVFTNGAGQVLNVWHHSFNSKNFRMLYVFKIDPVLRKIVEKLDFVQMRHCNTFRRSFFLTGAFQNLFRFLYLLFWGFFFLYRSLWGVFLSRSFPFRILSFWISSFLKTFSYAWSSTASSTLATLNKIIIIIKTRERKVIFLTKTFTENLKSKLNPFILRLTLLPSLNPLHSYTKPRPSIRFRFPFPIPCHSHVIHIPFPCDSHAIPMPFPCNGGGGVCQLTPLSLHSWIKPHPSQHLQCKIKVLSDKLLN